MTTEVSRGEAYEPWEPTSALSGTVRPPGSKSITNRAILCAALANGTSQLSGVLESEDTEVMARAWMQMGVAIAWDRLRATMVIEGCGGALAEGEYQLEVANSGTTLRFLTAALACIPSRYRLQGVPRMHERPVLDLLQGIHELGGRVRSLNGVRPDCPPLEIEGGHVAGGSCMVRGDVSSQYLSGLMMAAPLMQGAVTIGVEGELVSKPYVAMTAAVMERFGIVARETPTGYAIMPGRYRACEMAIEPDASAASYFFAAAAISGGCITVEGLSRKSWQGDVAFVEVLRAMGCQVTYGEGAIEVDGRAMAGRLRGGGTWDMRHISDTVQTLAVVALFADGPTTITGVAHNRHKETDRIRDLACELRKLGAEVREADDGLTIVPRTLKGATIETYHDHRMAMSLALAGLRIPGVRVMNPGCTSKTYPRYFEDMRGLIATTG